MFDQNKTIRLSTLLDQIDARIRGQQTEIAGALILFQTCVRGQVTARLLSKAIAGWDGRVNAGDCDWIYEQAIILLREAAGRLFSEVHQEIYEEASAVSLAFAEELNEVFECADEHLFDYVPIQSMLSQIAENLVE